MYHPVQTRLFAPDTPYGSIDWNSLRHVVASHKLQLASWYIDPCVTLLKNGHHGFAVVALTSMLVDCLSQYQAGLPESDKCEFKNFLKANIPLAADSFRVPIRAQFGTRLIPVTCAADALYTGIRCGILHEAHPTLYTAITGDQTAIFIYHGSPCPVVTVHPQMYFDRTLKVAQSYWQNLIDPAPRFNDLRFKFKTKFEKAFGVTININL
jgi:hypothetical protein